jgi:hypothetical protein
MIIEQQVQRMSMFQDTTAKGVHGAVAKVTGWGAPAQGSTPGCCTIYSNLWPGAHLLVTVVVAPFG